MSVLLQQKVEVGRSMVIMIIGQFGRCSRWLSTVDSVKVNSFERLSYFPIRQQSCHGRQHYEKMILSTNSFTILFKDTFFSKAALFVDICFYKVSFHFFGIFLAWLEYSGVVGRIGTYGLVLTKFWENQSRNAIGDDKILLRHAI